ncbi:MAG: membrane protein insertion efficiency factor YidD [Patescibacteria group bacterium]|nr:membrane protein insertion efficiency factor YidD [Patescibacteria group bacterium]
MIIVSWLISWSRNLIKNISFGLIKIYQAVFSLDHSFWARALFLGACRYQPTCSDYTYQAISKYGVIKGWFLGAKRVLRCHPLAKGGHDPLI